MTQKFPLQDNESFYGGAIEDGLCMPFKDGFKRDLRDWFSGNQASPTLLSSKGRILRGDKPFSFEFKNGELIIESEEELKLEKVGETLRDAYLYFSKTYFKNYKGHLDDLMFSAPQYDTWISMRYEPTEEKVLNYAKEILEQGYKPGVLILDDSWAIDYGVFEFNKNFFPHPEETIEKLHSLGFKVMVWETPFISADSRNYRELSKQGLLLKNTEGKDVITWWWNGYSAVLDLSKKEAREWLDSQNKSLMSRYKIDGFKMDASDPDYYPKNSVFSDNSHKAFQSKYYSEIGLNYSFNEMRACYQVEGAALSQRMRDKNHSWTFEGIERLVQNAISMSLMGYFYFAPDMVGGGMLCDFEREDFKFDEELFVRYAEIAVFLPMIQFSLLPWKCLSDANQKLMKSLMELRESLVPTILSLKKEAEEKHYPIIRPLFLEYPNDNYENVMDEFMLGEDILVAPILNKGQTSRTVVVPCGNWIDLDGNNYQKGTYNLCAPLGKPIFLKRQK